MVLIRKYLVAGLMMMMIVISACSSGSSDSSSLDSLDEPEEVQLESCVDYSLVDPDDPASYWEIYVNDVLCTKGSPNYAERNTNVRIQLVIQSPEEFASGITPDHAGYSTFVGYCNNEIVDIGVIKQYWDDYTEIQKLWLMYHEFGHDVHRYDHSIMPDDIMYPSVASSKVTMNDFIRAKNRFIQKKFDGISYINCPSSN